MKNDILIKIYKIAGIILPVLLILYLSVFFLVPGIPLQSFVNPGPIIVSVIYCLVLLSGPLINKIMGLKPVITDIIINSSISIIIIFALIALYFNSEVVIEIKEGQTIEINNSVFPDYQFKGNYKIYQPVFKYRKDDYLEHFNSIIFIISGNSNTNRIKLDSGRDFNIEGVRAVLCGHRLIIGNIGFSFKGKGYNTNSNFDKLSLIADGTNRFVFYPLSYNNNQITYEYKIISNDSIIEYGSFSGNNADYRHSLYSRFGFSINSESYYIAALYRLSYNSAFIPAIIIIILALTAIIIAVILKRK